MGQRPGGVRKLGRHRLRGRPLARGGRYLWRVRVWDDRGQVSDWSEHATFEVELHRAKGWRACWISQDRDRESVSPPDWPGPRDAVAAP